MHLAAGESRSVSIPIRVSDLARYDPSVNWVDLKGNPVTGAYVVDPGNYTLFVGACVSVGEVWDDTATCSGTQQVTLDLGSESSPWTYL